MAAEKTPREYILKAKLYRFVSLIFITIGVLVFCVMYIQNVEGRLLEALRDPMTVSIFLIPFVPAAVLTILADKNERKGRDLMNKDTPPAKK